MENFPVGLVILVVLVGLLLLVGRGRGLLWGRWDLLEPRRRRRPRRRGAISVGGPFSRGAFGGFGGGD